MKKAIFPGSFDPMTNGHLDILERCESLFDEVIIGVLNNPDKLPFLPIEERTDLVSEIIPPMGNCKFTVREFSGLLIDFAREQNIFTIVRGIRSLGDYEYEQKMALMNRALEPRFETILLVSNPNVSYVSSSLIKQIYRLGGKIDRFVPQLVAEKMNKMKLVS